MIEGQGRWRLGVIDAEHVQTACRVETDHVATLVVTVGIDGRDISDGAPLALHRDGCRSGQGSEHGVTDINDGQLAVLVFYGHQVTEHTLRLVADETVVAMLYEVVLQGFPVVKQFVAERLAIQSVDDDSVDGVAVEIVACHYQCVAV